VPAALQERRRTHEFTVVQRDITDIPGHQAFPAETAADVAGYLTKL
jgi:hypothetical protein